MKLLPQFPRCIRGLRACGALLALCPGLAAADSLRIDDAWVRAMPPGQSVTAAYFTLVNESDSAVTVLEAQADAAGQVSLHRTRQRDGVMTMEHSDWPTLAPGERVSLEPGGLHLMLKAIDDMPAAGETVELCLRTASARHCAAAVVRRGGAPAAQHSHHKSHRGAETQQRPPDSEGRS